MTDLLSVALARYVASVAPLIKIRGQYDLTTQEGAVAAISEAMASAQKLLTPFRAQGAIGEAEEVMHRRKNGDIAYGIVGLDSADAPDLLVLRHNTQAHFVEVKKKIDLSTRTRSV